MNNDIPCDAIIATLSYYRSDLEMSDFIGMAYSTTVAWNQNSKKFAKEKPYLRYMIEFYRRVNLEALDGLHEYYDLPRRNSIENISESLVSKKDFQSFLSSKVDWKKKIANTIMQINEDVFRMQSKIIKGLVAIEEKPKNMNKFFGLIEQSQYVIPPKVKNIDIAHLKDV